MTTIASWGLKLSPGKPHKFDSFPEDEENDLVLRISNIALGETLADNEGRTVVKITKHKSPLDMDEEEDEATEPELEEFVLCSLIPGKIEQITLNMEFGPDLVQFEVTGKNEVHLLGNWIDNSENDPPFGPDGEDSDEDSDEEAYRLQDVSSDVEMNPDDLDLDDDDDETDGSRFEELGGETKKLKRAADAMEEDAPNGAALSKKEKKKLAKKLKNADGIAVSVASGAPSVASPDAKKKEKGDDKKEKKEAKESGEKAQADKKTLPGGLVISDVKKGTGKAAKKGSKLSMRYIGKLENGKIFDKNTTGSPFRFRLGNGEVIKGWDQGLVGMQVGGERVLNIPAALGYGSKGVKPDIPPNSNLKFEVKLLELK